ncbi:MAG: 1-(5-phosphoribosyl)-5-[(5-phosphoribosylamino)methylideneamino]imidazole-4-carboxamide isomerase [Pseudomonadota bacterium]
MNIIPAIDIRDGNCVRLLYGEYDRETRYDVNAVALATRYADLGLTQLHTVDLDGARDGKPANTGLLKQMSAASDAQMQVGGGIRDSQHIQELLDAGVSRVVIGSLAIDDPDTVKGWFDAFGGERIVLALDVRLNKDAVPMVCTKAWTHTSDRTLFDTIDAYVASGLRHVLCTDIARDGALSGPSIALYQQLVTRYPTLGIQASGGVASIHDLHALRDVGVAGAITGKALLEGNITDEEIRSF